MCLSHLTVNPSAPPPLLPGYTLFENDEMRDHGGGGSDEEDIEFGGGNAVSAQGEMGGGGVGIKSPRLWWQMLAPPHTLHSLRQRMCK
jgi:hypothetical protein